MPFLDTYDLPAIERLPGWHGRYFQSQNMTFVHYEHFHPEEEVYEVIEGELEVTIDGVAQIARAGVVAIAPANVRHSVKASRTVRPSSWTIGRGSISDRAQHWRIILAGSATFSLSRR